MKIATTDLASLPSSCIFLFLKLKREEILWAKSSKKPGRGKPTTHRVQTGLQQTAMLSQHPIASRYGISSYGSLSIADRPPLSNVTSMMHHEMLLLFTGQCPAECDRMYRRIEKIFKPEALVCAYRTGTTKIAGDAEEAGQQKLHCLLTKDMQESCMRPHKTAMKLHETA